MNAKYQDWLTEQEEKGIIYKNENGIYVSNELLNNSKDYLYYRNRLENAPFNQLKLKYYNKIIELRYRTYSKNKLVIEIGCSSNVFAEQYIYEFNPDLYFGYEPYLSGGYVHNNLIVFDKYAALLLDQHSKIMESCDTFIALETLEHISYDIELINKIPINATLLISLPTQIASDHIRCFPVMESITERYGKFLSVIDIEPVYKKETSSLPKWWCMSARRNNFVI